MLKVLTWPFYALALAALAVVMLPMLAMAGIAILVLKHDKPLDEVRA